MQKLTKGKKIIISICAVVIAMVAIIVPVAVIYGSGSSSSSLNENKVTKDNNVIVKNAEYVHGKNTIMPKEQFSPIEYYENWSEPTYTLDEVGEISEVTLTFQEIQIVMNPKFSFFSEFYLYDENKNKVDYEVTEHTETIPGTTNGNSIDDWRMPSKDLWLIKKFLTDGKIGPEETINEVIASGKFTKERLDYVTGNDGVNLVLRREDFATSKNFSRILLLDQWQASTSLQRMSFKLTTPKKLSYLTYYFASREDPDFTVSFKTVDGFIFKADNTLRLTKDNKDVIEFRKSLPETGYTETITINATNQSYVQKILPIEEGTIYVKLGAITLKSLEDLENLPAGTKFTATYTTKKLEEYKLKDVPLAQIQKIIYTVKKGIPEPIQEGLTQIKDFYKDSTTLPADKSERVPGWLDWTVKFTNGTTEYKTLAELKALPLNTRFTATYTALIDSKYSSTKNAVYIVPYVVKNTAPNLPPATE